jgi:hypothetical protein
MNGEYCIRCEIFDKRTKASKYIKGPLGELIPLCEQCIEEVKEENDIFAPNTLIIDE